MGWLDRRVWWFALVIACGESGGNEESSGGSGSGSEGSTGTASAGSSGGIDTTANDTVDDCSFSPCDSCSIVEQNCGPGSKCVPSEGEPGGCFVESCEGLSDPIPEGGACVVGTCVGRDQCDLGLGCWIDVCVPICKYDVPCADAGTVCEYQEFDTTSDWGLCVPAPDTSSDTGASSSSTG